MWTSNNFEQFSGTFRISSSTKSRVLLHEQKLIKNIWTLFYALNNRVVFTYFSFNVCSQVYELDCTMDLIARDCLIKTASIKAS